jgi:hypothetical protein
MEHEPPPPPAGDITKLKVAVAVPQGLVIVTGILNVPDMVDVPEIVLEAESKFKPAGNPAPPMLKVIAPAVVGVVVAVKV